MCTLQPVMGGVLLSVQLSPAWTAGIRHSCQRCTTAGQDTVLEIPSRLDSDAGPFAGDTGELDTAGTGEAPEPVSVLRVKPADVCRIPAVGSPAPGHTSRNRRYRQDKSCDVAEHGWQLPGLWPDFPPHDLETAAGRSRRQTGGLPPVSVRPADAVQTAAGANNKTAGEAR